MSAPREAGCFAQAAPGGFLVLPACRRPGRGPVGRGSGAQPIALLSGQAGVADPVPLIVHAGPGPVLAGEHRDDVHVIGGVAFPVKSSVLKF
jgi:hypothetical protein